MDAYWRAANYLSVGQIYLSDNPLLKKTLTKEHIKPRLLGHWGTTPGLNFIYVHLNRLIKKHDLNMIYIAGPGMAARGFANAYLEGTYSEVYPDITPDEEGMKRLFTSSRSRVASPATSRRNSRLYARGRRTRLRAFHAYGAAFDNPDLIVACVIGDGEAETGPLRKLAFQQLPQSSARWCGSADPAPQRLQDCQSLRLGTDQPRGLDHLFRGYGSTPYFVEGENRRSARAHGGHARYVVGEIQHIKADARRDGFRSARMADDHPAYPQGMDLPERNGRHPIEGSFRAHQVPIARCVKIQHLESLKLDEEL